MMTNFARCLFCIVMCLLPLSVAAQDNPPVDITILAKQNLALHSRPDFYSNVLSIFESGETLGTFGRDGDGAWLQTAEGWVNGRNVAADGDIMTLRQTAEAITLQASEKLDLRSGPDGSYRTTDTLPKGQLTVAIGRNHDGTWLETLKGWIRAGDVDFDGHIMTLPVSFASITVIATKNGAILSAPTWEADVLEIFQRGAEAFAYERTEDGNWVKTPKGWLHIASGMNISGDLNSLPLAYMVSLTARSELSVFSGPAASYSILGALNEGDETLALMRSENGHWLQIPQGWVLAESADIGGDKMQLPFSPTGIKGAITTRFNVRIRTEPNYTAEVTSELLRLGDEVLAIGRTKSGNWLLIPQGWIESRTAKLDQDRMNLPVTDERRVTTTSTVANQTQTRTPTPTPTPTSGLTAPTLRTLIARHTDDIRILDIKIGASTTTIEYDLKPWPFVPNESIANEVAFKIICAIRVGQQIPNALKFIGHTHFKSEVGRKFTGPSVEMQISARNANRIVCRGNDPSDINWRSLASRYKSYPVPRGASIDYD